MGKEEKRHLNKKYNTNRKKRYSQPKTTAITTTPRFKPIIIPLHKQQKP